MKKIVISYLGGGSKNWAHNYFADLLSQDKISGTIRLYDIDEEAAENNKKYFDKMIQQNREKVLSQWECVVSNSIEESLTGAEFVLVSVLPHKLDNMHHDVHYPERYGIYQSVGDTVGPGGYSRALRTIPIFKFFGEKIKENCPNAWVINYTNPLSICVNTLCKAFPEIKAFGCCHEVFGTQELFAGILGLYKTLSEQGKREFMEGNLAYVKKELKKKGRKINKPYPSESIFHHEMEINGIKRQNIKVNVQGINHFTWVNTATYLGEDIFPIYSAYIKLFRANNKKFMGKAVPAIIKRIVNHESVKFELFEKYNIASAAGDRHLAEFLPAMYLKDKHVFKYGFELTPVFARKIWNRIRLKHISKVVNGNKKVVIKTSGEEGVNQIIALLGIEDLTTNVNIINKGQSPGLPMGTAVETNAKFSLDSIEAVNAGEMKKEIVDLVLPHAENQKAFVEAYFEKDKKKLLEVFLNDPSVARLSKDKGEKLFLELIEKNKECLEDFLL